MAAVDTFGERITDLRIAKGLSQADIARVLHVSSNTVSGYENNQRYPKYSQLVLLADFFGVTTDYLLGRAVEEPRAQGANMLFCKADGAFVTIGEIGEAILKLSAGARMELVKYIELLTYRDTH